MKRKRDEIKELVTQGRTRNRLLTAKTMKAEVRQAAERVARLSAPGTPERLITLMAVAEEAGLSASAIVDELVEGWHGEKEQP